MLSIGRTYILRTVVLTLQGAGLESSRMSEDRYSVAFLIWMRYMVSLRFKKNKKGGKKGKRLCSCVSIAASSNSA